MLAATTVFSSAHAQDATWLASPGTSDFNTGANWSSATVPTGTAPFGASNTTTIGLSTSATLGGLTFEAGAPAYTFNATNGLVLNGAGIVNNSSNASTLTAQGFPDRCSFSIQ